MQKKYQICTSDFLEAIFYPAHKNIYSQMSTKTSLSNYATEIVSQFVGRYNMFPA